METIIILCKIASNFNDWTSYRRWCCQFIDHSSILLNFNDEIIFDWIPAGRSIVTQTPEKWIYPISTSGQKQNMICRYSLVGQIESVILFIFVAAIHQL